MSALQESWGAASPDPRPAWRSGRPRRSAPAAAPADLVLWTADPGWAGPVRAAGEAAGLTAAVAETPDASEVSAGSAGVLIVDLDHSPAGDADSALQAALRLVERLPGLPTVLVVEEESVAVYRGALRHGLRHVVRREEGPDAVLQAARAARRSQGPEKGAAEPKPAAVWAVCGAQGGVGRTTLATNLAVALSRRGRRTALLDLNAGLGVAHVFLDLQPRRPVSELLSDLPRLDGDLLEEYMPRHDSGVRLLPAPLGADLGGFVTAEHVDRIVTVARERFEDLVLDLPAGFPAFAEPALRRATALLVVAAPDLAGLSAAQLALAGAAGGPADRARTRLVLRHAERRHGLTAKDVEAALRTPVWAHLPWDGRATTPALNRGVPSVLARPRSRYAAAVARVVALLDKERR